MKVTEVSLIDGRMCAQLVNLLKAGRWDLSGSDITAHNETVRWVVGLAQQCAAQLDPKTAKPADTSMKVKAMGSLPTSGTIKKSGKIKKK